MVLLRVLLICQLCGGKSAESPVTDGAMSVGGRESDAMRDFAIVAGSAVAGFDTNATHLETTLATAVAGCWCASINAIGGLFEIAAAATVTGGGGCISIVGMLSASWGTCCTMRGASGTGESKAAGEATSSSSSGTVFIGVRLFLVADDVMVEKVGDAEPLRNFLGGGVPSCVGVVSVLRFVVARFGVAVAASVLAEEMDSMSSSSPSLAEWKWSEATEWISLLLLRAWPRVGRRRVGVRVVTAAVE